MLKVHGDTISHSDLYQLPAALRRPHGEIRLKEMRRDRGRPCGMEHLQCPARRAGITPPLFFVYVAVWMIVRVGMTVCVFMFVSVDIPREGYPGLLVLGPDRSSGWLYPEHRMGDTYLKVQAGPKFYFRRQTFMLRRPGSWLFIHVMSDEPILPSDQQEILGGLRSGFYWHLSPDEAALPLKHLLGSVFSHVIVHRFVSLPHAKRR